ITLLPTYPILFLSFKLSPMFNLEYLLPEELLPLTKRGRDRSSSSTSALPQAFEIGESSRKTSLERYEEQIERMPPKRTSTCEAPAMTQAAIKKLVADNVATALEVQAATMTNTDNTNRNTREKEAPVARYNCTEDCKVKFATGTLTEEALSWWNSFAQPIGIEEAYKTTWGNDLKTYVRRFQELTTLCPTMVPDSEKMIEVFNEGLP
ncbi:hypothetical protein Tco_1036602, partial [Tanacetum coccineum]